MTLILTCATPWYLMQVSDRLLTTRLDTTDGVRVSPWDPSSNKSVIFQATNAVVSLGYTGPGFIEGVPTDTWIVERLSSKAIPGAEFGRPFGLEVGRTRQAVDIGSAIETLRSECQTACSRMPDGSLGRLEISLCGWQWKRKGKRFESRPILHEIQALPASECESKPDGLPRYWDFNKEQRERYRLSVMPDGHLSDSQLEDLCRELDGVYRDPEATADVLIETMRNTSEKHPEVGSDCMVVHMPLPSLRRIEATYVSEVTRGDEPVAGYSPWVVSSYTRTAPSEIVGNMEIGLGFFTVYIRGAPPTASTAGWPEGFPDPPDEFKALNPNWKTARTVFRMRSQPRRTWP